MTTSTPIIARFVANSLTAATLSATVVLVANACSESEASIGAGGETSRAQRSLTGVSSPSDRSTAPGARLAVQQAEGDAGPDGGEGGGDGGADGGGSCIPDAFEPNDSSEATRPIVAPVQVSANLCDGTRDYYSFDAPDVEGLGFSVHVRTKGPGVDVLVVALPATGTVGTYTVTDEGTRIDVISSSDSFGLRVLGDSAAVYSVDIGKCEVCNNDAAESDCCTVSDAPGCTDDAVFQCICETDPRCCTGSFDELCVTQAIAACGVACELPPPASDCCSASDVPGCRAPDVQACVCDIDPYCCANGFDGNCARLAQDHCGAVCAE